MAPLALIVAYAVPSRVIGADGRMPWHEPEDLKRFKAMTTGHAVIMGRRTWDSLGRPLPKRRNLVVTRQKGLSAPGAEIFPDLATAIAAARATDPEPCIIGGATLYAQALPLATRLELTEIAIDVAGDTLLPAIDEAPWHETGRQTAGRLTFRTLVRRSP